jgi:6-phosphogluconate dehydrogenase
MSDGRPAGAEQRARHVGVTGMATMGQNLARNIASHGFPVAVHNRTTAKTTTFVAEHGHEGDIVGLADVPEFVAALERPRAVVVMVQAGAPVDDVLAQLLPHLDRGDLVVDGGNSDFRDTERRVADAAARGVGYLGCGVSGGEEGALHGPSLMPGGSRVAYAQIEDVLTSIAASVRGEPCCTYVGDGGAGHYVKMVHNGIEYADMQLIAEAYDLLRTRARLTNDELADTFAAWNCGDLESYLIEITAQILRRRLAADESADGALLEEPAWLVDVVSDRAEQKGTGRLTVVAALDASVPAATTAEAVFARMLSSRAEERAVASRRLPGPHPDAPREDGGLDPADRDAFVEAVRRALYASKIVAYAQGFYLLRRGGVDHGWDLDLGALATIWRGGCIIRARFLDRIRNAYDEQRDLASLLLAPTFRADLTGAQDSWRAIVADGARTGIPLPAFSSALAFYDGARRARSPANLIQAQRDLFGAHTYERVDRPGTFHSDW